MSFCYTFSLKKCIGSLKIIVSIITISMLSDLSILACFLLLRFDFAICSIKNPSYGFLAQSNVVKYIRQGWLVIPPAQRSCWGGILVSLRPSVRLSVCPSVRPSVRPSVPHAVSTLYHLQLWMDSFHIRHKWSLPWEGVSCTMTFDLDLYLQGHLALT